MKALIGKKIGMTQIFKEDGSAVGVTVLDVSENYVSKHLKSNDAITHIEIGKDKKKNPNKADIGNYKDLTFVPRFKRTIKTSEALEIGTKLTAATFAEGDRVTIVSTSKGKGFQGVMKRWNFKGGKRTHGQSDRERAPGSIGSGTTPGRVIKGLKMAGRMGRDKKSLKNVEVIQVLNNDNLISVKGPIAGFNGSYVFISSK